MPGRFFTKPIQAPPATSPWSPFSGHSRCSSFWKPGSSRFEGYLVDIIGPPPDAGESARYSWHFGWVGSGYAETITPAVHLVRPWVGIGAGIVYGGSIGNAPENGFPDHRGPLRRPDRRGLLALATASTISPVAQYAENLRLPAYLRGLGASSRESLSWLARCFLARAASGMDAAKTGLKSQPKSEPKLTLSTVNLTPWQMLRQPSFYVIYLMMTMLAFGGLVVYLRKLNPMASTYHVDNVIVAFGMTALVAGDHGWTGC